jgi:hypothetical protein
VIQTSSPPRAEATQKVHDSLAAATGAEDAATRDMAAPTKAQARKRRISGIESGDRRALP